jgi:hypothetical protein
MHMNKRRATLTLLLALVCALALGGVATAKPFRGTATLDLRIRLTGVTATHALGAATFIGALRDGTPVTGKGTVRLAGTRVGKGFRATGKGTLRFTATARRADGSTSRIANVRGTLTFLGGTTEGTGIFWEDIAAFVGGTTDGTGILWEDVTVSFLGGSQEGTGI